MTKILVPCSMDILSSTKPSDIEDHIIENNLHNCSCEIYPTKVIVYMDDIYVVVNFSDDEELVRYMLTTSEKMKKFGEGCYSVYEWRGQRGRWVEIYGRAIHDLASDDLYNKDKEQWIHPFDLNTLFQ